MIHGRTVVLYQSVVGSKKHISTGSVNTIVITNVKSPNVKSPAVQMDLDVAFDGGLMAEKLSLVEVFSVDRN